MAALPGNGADYKRKPRVWIGYLKMSNPLFETVNGVTQYAVEEGAPVSDHISSEAEKLTIEGVVTGASVSLFGVHGRSKMIEAKEALRVINEQRQPITIVTGLDVYPEFAMESCDISRNADDGEKLHISISLTKIRKAKTREADIPPGKVRQNAAGKAGNTETGRQGNQPPADGKNHAQPAGAAKGNTGGRQVSFQSERRCCVRQL